MPAQYLETRDIPIGDLTPYPGNARRGDVDRIRESVRANGQYRSLVVRRRASSLVVLAGNHTLAALHAEGAATARCELVECDDDTALRINLVDNRAAEVGSYDDDALAVLLRQLDDPIGSGWLDDEIAVLLADDSPAGVLADAALAPDFEEDEAELEPPAVPVTRPGDVWLLGPHRVLCGDSTDMAAVEAMLAGDRCDTMWTDPPYGVDYVGKTKDALTIRNDGAADLPELLAGAFAVATAALKPGAPLYIAHPPGPLSLQFAQAFLDAGWLFRQNLIWVKNSLVLGRSDYHYRHEPILYGFTDAPAGSGRLGRGGDRWFGDDAQTTVFEVAKPARSEVHPTMKPVELVARCLANSCPPRGAVYDPFGGSGTTLIAAQAGRYSARLVEIDPCYVDVICRRYQTLTGEKPVLEATGEAHDFSDGSGV